MAKEMDWPVPGHDVNHSRMAAADLQPPFTVAWVSKALGSEMNGREVVGAKGVAVAALESGALVFLDRAGKVVREVPAEKPRKGMAPRSAPWILDDAVLVPRESKLQCYGLEDGKLRWDVADQEGRDLNGGKKLAFEQDFDQGILGIDANQCIVTGSRRGAVRKFNVKSGKLASVSMTWSPLLHAAGASIYGWFRSNELGEGTPSIMDMNTGTVTGPLELPEIRVGREFGAAKERAFRAGDTWLCCCEARTGKKIWQIDYKKSDGNLVMRTATDGALVFVPNKKWVAAYDLDTGVERWKSSPKDLKYGDEVGIALTPSQVVLITAGGILEVLDKSTGERTWRSDDLPLEGDPSPPSILVGGLYLSDGGRIVRLEGSRA